jgi:WhiB family redox-sensing transcriptional regulator
MRKAKALCDECPVQAECLEAGMDEEYGIWGGLSPKQRRRLKKGAA